jgi:class 3 adenylate cyclase
MAGQFPTLVLLYTDIESSTKHWERQPETMRAALGRHDRILRQAIQDHDGNVLRKAGDAFCAYFTASAVAVAAAVQAQ